MRFNSNSLKFKISLSGAIFLLLLLLAAGGLPPLARAHGGEDHADEKSSAPAAAQAGKNAVTITRAERNLQTAAGEFNIRLERVPADPRVGETSQLALRIAEKVEGGFGGGSPVPIENAVVTINITTADNQTAVSNIPMKAEAEGVYRALYAFERAGNYKLVFAATTLDNRSVSVDFPASVVNAPLNWTFWLGITVLSLLTVGVLGTVFVAARKRSDENFGKKAAGIAPIAVAAVLFFAFGALALGYFEPPREKRSLGELPKLEVSGMTEQTTAATALQSSLIVPKESQLLFGIKTELVTTRKIISGLKVSGTVRARPDARAVVAPPVAGKILLRPGISLGTAVGRGERIGTIEQILSVEAQASLESQRVAVEAQRLSVEAQRIQLRNSLLEQQARQSEQRSVAAQARTRLAQANRELRRSENLLEAGAVPRRRVEEANTAVKIAEQEIAAAEQQVKLIDGQIRQFQTAQGQLHDFNPAALTRNFPLTAPVTGIIADIKATSGQQVEAGFELLSIINLSTVLLEANVFEKDLLTVRESTRASFTAAALNNEVYKIGETDGEGKLASIAQNVNPETRAVAIIYEVKNPLGRLRDGNFVEITIDTSGDAQVLAVPKNAVINDNGETFVFVFTGGESFERRAIAVGANGADFDEVKAGLKEGERVVTNGIYQLRATQPAT